MTLPQQPFKQFWDLGYRRLIPIVPPDAAVSEKSTLAKRLDSRGKAPGVRGQDGLWRGLDWLKHVTTEDDLALWAGMQAGVGIRTGDGLIALDIDSTNDLISHQAVELAKAMFGHAPIRVGRAPKAILIYRTSGPIPYQRIEFAGTEKNERIELLTEGRQFVAHGVHPATNKPYIWPAGIPPYAELTTITEQQVDAYFKALAAKLPAASITQLTPANDRTNINQSSLTGDDNLVQAAVHALPNTTELFPTYDDYIRVGAAIKGATQHNPQLGEELFLQWAGRWDGGNDPDRTLADYSRIKPPYELGAHWLYDTADRYSGGKFSATSAWFTPIQPEPEPLFPTANNNHATKPTRFTRNRLYSAGDLTAAKPTPSLVKGLLSQGAASVIYGRSNSGKTFVAMDIAFHIAAGLPWGGMRTANLPVLYVAAEGGHGVRLRAAALRHKYPKEAKSATFDLIMSGLDLFSDSPDIEGLIQAAKDLQQEANKPTGLIVIDTLARAMAGGDENSAKDMSTLIRHVDTIREATSAHVMIVHHSGKDASKGARGSGALLAAIDTEIEIADNTISVTKQRDIDRNFSVRFALDIIPLGQDADGDDMTSCTVRLLEGRQVDLGIATPKERDVYEALAVLEGLSASDSAGVAMGDIVAFMDNTSEKMGSEAVRFHLKALATKGLVVRAGRGKWKVRSGGKSGGSFFENEAEEDEAEESGGKNGGNIFE